MLTEQIQAMIDRHVAGSPRARAAAGAARRSAHADRCALHAMAHHAARQRRETALVSRDDAATRRRHRRRRSTVALLVVLREDPADVIRRGRCRHRRRRGTRRTRFRNCCSCCARTWKPGSPVSSATFPPTARARCCARRWTIGRSSLRTQATNVGEYLAHEKRVLVPRTEADQFLQEVDACASRPTGCAARVARAGNHAEQGMKLRVLVRLIRIHRVLVRYGLVEFVARHTLCTASCAIVLLLSPWVWFQGSARPASRGARLRLALRSARPGVREVRAGHLHAPRPAAPGHRRTSW